jgi:hypothetical protein
VRQRSAQQDVGGWQRQRQRQTDKAAGTRSDRKAGRCGLSLPLFFSLSLLCYHRRHHQHHDHDEIVLGSLEPWMHLVCVGVGALALPWNLVSRACLPIQSRACTHTQKHIHTRRARQTCIHRHEERGDAARLEGAWPVCISADCTRRQLPRSTYSVVDLGGEVRVEEERLRGVWCRWNDRRTTHVGTGRWCIMCRMNGSLSGPGRAQSTR